VFRQLSVFRGGFREEAASRVARAPRLLLSALTDKSLLRRDASGRYDMHELLRQYAAEKLNEVSQESAKTQDLHCGYYAAFLHQREAHLKGGKQREALEEIGREIENVRVAWRWAVEQGKTKEIGKSLDSLCRFYDMRSWFEEGEATFRHAVARLAGKKATVGHRPERSEGSALVLGEVLARQGRLCLRLGLNKKARDILQQSVDILRHLDAQHEMAFSLIYLGSATYGLGKYALAKQLHQQSLAIYREIGDRSGMAISLLHLGTAVEQLGEHTGARRLYRESLALFREIGDRWGTARALNNLGNAAYYLQQYTEAKQLYQESLTVRREINDQLGIASSLNNLGEAAYALGEYHESKQYFHAALKAARDRSLAPVTLHVLVWIATLLAKEGEKERALELLTLTLHHPAVFSAAKEDAEHLLAELASQLPPQVVAMARERGKARELEEVVDELLRQ